jgi:hypothetical protein
MKMEIKQACDNTKTQKLAKCIELFEIMREGAKFKASELVKILGVSGTRKIYYYRETLSLFGKIFGFEIKSYGGVNGGYQLHDIRFSDKEKEYIERNIKNKKILKKILTFRSFEKEK